MRKISKVLVLVLSAIMVLAMSVSVFAKNDSITVTGTKSGETLKIYKMLDLVVDDEQSPTAYKYTIATGWTEFFTTGAGKDYVTIDPIDGHVTWIDGKKTAEDMVIFAQEAAKIAANIKGTIVASGDSVVFSGLEDGYYLITSTLGTKAMIETTPDESAVTIHEKNPEDTVAKTVKEDTTFGTENDAQVGDTVDFKTTVDLQPYTTNVKIHDTMDSALSFNNDIVVSGGTPAITANDYEILETPDAGDTFTIKIKDSYIEKMTEASEITVTYSAVLTADVITSTPSITDQKNTAKVTYGDKQSKESETTTTTHSFAVYKYAKGKTVNLAGAVFKVKKNGTALKLTKINETNYKIDPNGAEETFITVSTDNITIWGVDTDGPYTLEETQAPDGYNKLANEVSVTVEADNRTIVDIPNDTGAELPTTGGIGTTIFYIVGSLLVIGCGIVLVSRRRMRDK